jgi:hypothetical protein
MASLTQWYTAATNYCYKRVRMANRQIQSSKKEKRRKITIFQMILAPSKL